jgi:psiF repeat
MRLLHPSTLGLVGALIAVPVLAQTPAPGGTAGAGASVSQRDRMKACNAQAKTESLKGDARKQFMATCLSGNASPSTPAAATAPAPARTTTVPNPTTTAPRTTSAPTPATKAPAGVGTSAAVFPSAVSPKYASEPAGKARMHTCLDQYNANKATNGNGGLNWIAKGGGYYAQCNARLKGQS